MVPPALMATDIRVKIAATNSTSQGPLSSNALKSARKSDGCLGGSTRSLVVAKQIQKHTHRNDGEYTHQDLESHGFITATELTFSGYERRYRPAGKKRKKIDSLTL